MNAMDNSPMDVNSTINIIPEIKFHLKTLRCLAKAGDAMKETNVTLLVDGKA